MTKYPMTKEIRMTNDESPGQAKKMTNDSSSQFTRSRSRETLGTYANAQTLTSSATTTIRLMPNWEVLNDEIPNDEGNPND